MNNYKVYIPQHERTKKCQKRFENINGVNHFYKKLTDLKTDEDTYYEFVKGRWIEIKVTIHIEILFEFPQN